MSRRGIALACTFCLVASVAWGQAAPQLIKVHVRGMVCAFCAQGLIKTFGKNAAVDHVEASLEEKILRVYLKSQKHLAKAEVVQMVEDAGFESEGVELPEDVKPQVTN